jgi:putative aldouronate transport system substrate-binding protein
MPIPRTFADYERLFEGMQRIGITPFMPARNGYVRQLIGAHGIMAGTGDNVFFRDENGRVFYGQVRPEFRQYLELMNRWYNRGFISRDFPAIDMMQTRTLFDTRNLGMFIDAIVLNFNRGLTLGFEMTSAPYPRQYLGQQLHFENTDIWPIQWKGMGMASVSSRARNAEAAIRWLNYGYTESGFELYNWGVEGVNWNWVNGRRVYNDLMLEHPFMGTQETSEFFKMHAAPKRADFDTICHANLLRSPQSLAARMRWGDDPNVDSRLMLPPYQLTEAEMTLRTRIMSPIITYTDEMVLRFITGAEPLTRFDHFVNTIQGMGLADVLASEQRAFDRHMARRLSR